MRITLLSRDAWPTIRNLCRRSGRRLVAVPYVGTGATTRLPLKAGDLLVTKLDESSAKAGLINPAEIVKYIRAGVEVHHVVNLHAKVFVLGKTVVVGSANVSATSEHSLVEAAILTDQRSILLACTNLVKGLSGDLIGLEFARRLQGSYRPPRPPFPSSGGRPRGKASIMHSDLWAVPVYDDDWYDIDNEQADLALARAQSRVKNPKRFIVEEFQWTGRKFLKDVRVGHRVLQCTTERDGHLMISPPARVIEVHRYRARGGQHAIVCLEVPRYLRRKSEDVVARRLGSLARVVQHLGGARRLRSPALVYAIGQLWAKDGSRT